MFKKILLSLLLVTMTLTASAQNSRQYVKNMIAKYNECKSVAITRTNGDAMIYGVNGYAAKDCPTGFVNALSSLHDQGETLQDIHLSESGRWLILYGGNGMRWERLYSDLEREIRRYNENRETITTVTFNDDGEWIIITTDHICASSDEIQEWLAKGCKDYGKLWTACLTDDALIAVYDEGYKFLGNVPEDLKKALKETNKDVYMVKMAGTSWFFASKDGYWRYSM